MRCPEHDTLLGIALLVIGLALLVAARIAWGEPPVIAYATRSAQTATADAPSAQKAFRTLSAAKQPPLTYAQKQIMVEAYQAGYHVGLPLAFTAVVYVESDFRCRTGDHGLARGCAQIHAVAVRAATGMDIPVWQYDLPQLEDVDLAIGARYFAQCIQRWGWPAGIGVYNVGPTIAARLGRKRLANLPYTRAVLAAMAWLRQLPESDNP